MKNDPQRSPQEHLAWLKRNFPTDAWRARANAALSLKLRGEVPMEPEDAEYLEWIKREDPERYRDIETLASLSREDVFKLSESVCRDYAEPHVTPPPLPTDLPPDYERCPRWCPFAHAIVAILIIEGLHWLLGEARWVKFLVSPLALYVFVNLWMGLFFSQAKLDKFYNRRFGPALGVLAPPKPPH